MLQNTNVPVAASAPSQEQQTVQGQRATSSYVVVPQMMQQIPQMMQHIPQMVQQVPQMVQQVPQMVQHLAPQNFQHVVPQTLQPHGFAPTINIGLPSAASLMSNATAAQEKTKKIANMDNYDTFLEAKINEMSEEFKVLHKEQSQLTKEQQHIQKQFSNLETTLTQLQKQQDLHIDWQELQIANSKVKRKVDDSGAEIFEIFSTRKPKNATAGFSSGMKSIGKSFAMGVQNMAVQPVSGAQKEGVSGFVKGVAKGVGLGIALPVGGMVTGVYQAGRGVANGGTSKSEKKVGKMWDPELREWYWPETLKDQEKVIHQLEYNIEKQKEQALEQGYKMIEQDKILKKITDYLNQQIENVGDWCEQDGEKFSYLKRRFNEQKEELQKFKSMKQQLDKNSGVAQVQSSKHKEVVESQKPTLRKGLSQREKKDLDNLRLKENLLETRKKIKELRQKLDKQKKAIEKQEEMTKKWQGLMLPKYKDILTKQEDRQRVYSSNERQKENGEAKKREVEKYKVVMSSAVPVPLADYLPENDKLILRPYANQKLHESKKHEKVLQIDNALTRTSNNINSTSQVTIVTEEC